LSIAFSSCKKKPEDVLADIKKKKEEINSNLKKLKTKHVDDITSITGGSITGYYKDDEIKKIYAEHFGDKSRVFTEYYFDDGLLIFVMKQEFIYNRPQSYTEELARSNNDTNWYDDKKTRLEMDRFYFNKNKLVKWIDGNNADIPVNKPEFINKESSLWAETVILMKQLKEE
jgi:hypothetical protein